MFDESVVPPPLLDTYLGGHAVLIVGYRNNEAVDDQNSHRPGGGYFTFCNSWREHGPPATSTPTAGTARAGVLVRRRLSREVVKRVAGPQASG